MRIVPLLMAVVAAVVVHPLTVAVAGAVVPLRMAVVAVDNLF
ncbi:MAG TPA: hypothetical protein VK880_01505 [Anaerolineales bacterium]|nr:hypothetical protein [Anaerolineales bacterium]